MLGVCEYMMIQYDGIATEWVDERSEDSSSKSSKNESKIQTRTPRGVKQDRHLAGPGNAREHRQ